MQFQIFFCIVPSRLKFLGLEIHFGYIIFLQMSFMYFQSKIGSLYGTSMYRAVCKYTSAPVVKNFLLPALNNKKMFLFFLALDLYKYVKFVI